MFGWFGYATFHPGISSERTQKQLVKGAGVSFQDVAGPVNEMTGRCYTNRKNGMTYTDILLLIV